MDRYQFILNTLKKAGDLLNEKRKESFIVSAKGGDPRDLVTTVDVLLSDFIVSEIKSAFPNEAIYSEEIGEAILNAKTFWTIDPIDGTSNFTRSIPHFAICIGFVENNRCITGGIFNPVTNELFSFEKGKGAFFNGEKTTVSNIRELKDASVILHAGRKEYLWKWGGNFYTTLLEKGKKVINLSSSALDIVFIGAGRVEATIYGRISCFDVACAFGFLEEAGGMIVGGDYEPLKMSFEPQKIIAANSQEILNSLIEIDQSLT